MTCDKVNAKVEVQSDGSWKILEILGRHEQAYERKKFTNNRREICLKNKESAVDKIKWVWWFLKEELHKFYQTGERYPD